MSLKRVRNRRRASITSLIDVIFLLLLFFMLASTFSKFSEIDIAVANASGGGGATSSEIATLRIQADRIYFNETETLDRDLVARLNDLTASGTSGVMINLADDVSTQRLVDVLSIVKQVPSLSIQIEEPS